MFKVAIFAEDTGHEKFLTPLIERIGARERVSIRITPVSVRGGFGKVVSELRQYLNDIRGARVPSPDLLIIATDANCKGRAARLAEVKGVLKEYEHITSCAIPDPHIERWYLLDSAAFKIALGTGCSAPDHKCERQRYKKLLADAVRNAGIEPLIGGIEYAEDIVAAIDLDRMIASQNSLSDFLGDIIPKVRALRRR